jgi:hypothetical protein
VTASIVALSHHAYAQTWTDSVFPTQTGVFTTSFDAVPSVVNQDTVIGLSQAPAAQYSDLATIVRFNDLGQIDVRNGGSYAAAVSLPYVAQAKYHVRMAVDIPAHTYSVFVTPPGQAEIALAQNYAFRTEQAAVSALAVENEGSSIGTVAITNLSSNVAGICPYAATVGIADGCAGAPAGAAQYAGLLTKYGSNRPPFDVAGVDYAVGVPSGTALTPWTSFKNPYCSVTTSTVSCSCANAQLSISAVDFSANNGAQLVLNGCPTTISKSKWGGTNLLKVSTGVIDTNAPLTLTESTMDGGSIGNFPESEPTLIFARNGVTAITLQYNYFTNIPSRVLEVLGSTNLIYQWNFIGPWNTGAGAHDNNLEWDTSGVQTTPYIAFNTIYDNFSSGGGAGEGYQLYSNSSGMTLQNPTLSYNTSIALLYNKAVTMSYVFHGPGAATKISGTCSVANNSFDVTGAYGAFYPGTFSTCSLANNWNLVTGQAYSAKP